MSSEADESLLFVVVFLIVYSAIQGISNIIGLSFRASLQRDHGHSEKDLDDILSVVDSP